MANNRGVMAKFQNEMVLKALRNLPQNIQNNVMTGAVRAGAKTIADEAKELVPIDTGDLKKSIKPKKRRAKRYQTKFTISPVRGKGMAGWRAHFVEFGTSKQSAQPFMRPAYENNDDKAIKAIGEYIHKRIPEEVAKAKR